MIGLKHLRFHGYNYYFEHHEVTGIWNIQGRKYWNTLLILNQIENTLLFTKIAYLLYIIAKIIYYGEIQYQSPLWWISKCHFCVLRGMDDFPFFHATFVLLLTPP